MKAVVAGGAGFVGSHLCRRLLSAGHDVVCVDNFLTGSRHNLVDMVGRDNFTLLETDVVDTPALDVDVVFHLASPASPVDYDRLPIETLAANSVGTWRLLEVARASSARFVYASTSEVYGDPLVHPQAETYLGNVDTTGPRACYDEGKRFGEALVASWRRVHGVHAAIVRIFNTYGPGMRVDDGRVVPELLAAAVAGRPLKIHGDGRQTRSFMFVDDLIDALALVGDDGSLDGLVLNVGNPHERTITELAETVAQLANGEAEVVHVGGRVGDPRRRKPDISRIRQRYGWEPQYGLEDGLRLTLAWFTGRMVGTEDVNADVSSAIAR